MHARSWSPASSVLPASASHAARKATKICNGFIQLAACKVCGLSADLPAVNAHHRSPMLQARLLTRPLRIPLSWQPTRQSERLTGCAQLPPLRAMSAKLFSARAMSTTAIPTQTNKQKTKKGNKKKDDSELQTFCTSLVLGPCWLFSFQGLLAPKTAQFDE